MRRLLLAFLALLLFHFVESRVSKKALKIVKNLKKLRKLKQSLKTRNLESTDLSDIESGEIPILLKNPTAKLHFLDINGFTPYYTSTKKFFTFNIFFYFLNMLRPKKLYVPLRIQYRILRLLVDDTTANATCERVDGSETEEDVLKGVSQKYTCSSSVDTAKDISSIGIDASKGVATEDDNGNPLSVINAEEINFSNDAANYAQNIEKSKYTITEVILLQKGYLVEDGKNSDSYFEIKGNLIKIENTTLDLNLTDKPSNENKIITCQINYGDKVDEKNYNVTLGCDTNNEALNADLYWRSGISGTTKVILNMTDSTSNVNELGTNSTSRGSRFSYRKSSSGLSGGAIAGIVIACVVALIAASLAAIMLRKPTQPIDNTTVVGLKTIENM